MKRTNKEPKSICSPSSCFFLLQFCVNFMILGQNERKMYINSFNTNMFLLHSFFGPFLFVSFVSHVLANLYTGKRNEEKYSILNHTEWFKIISSLFTTKIYEFF